VTVALAGTETDRPPETVRRVGVELGATVLRSLDGVGPAVSPVVRVDWAVRSWLVLQAELAGLGSQPTVEAPGGTARVAQEHAVFGVCDCLSARRLHPTFALSAGVLQTSADGQASSPAQGHATRHRSFLLQASVGARLALGGRYELALAAHAQVAEPYVAIAVLDQVAATVGRPNVLMSLTLGGWL